MHQSNARVVVANPSSNPEIFHAASALAEAGMLDRYFVPIAATKGQERWIDRLMPGGVSRPILTELRRRPVPPGVPQGAVRRMAIGADLRRVAAARLGAPPAVRTRLAHQHRAAFDAGVAKKLRRGDRALLGVLGTATATMRAAKQLEIETFLDVPISHHGFIRDLMREEARLVPAYASTLQGHDFPDAIILAHEEEFAAADHLFVLSSHARQTLLARGVNADKMLPTPLGVDLELFRPMPRVDDGVFRIVFVGQVTQRKGISYLIEAFRLAGVPSSELLFVGEVIGSADPWISVPNLKYERPVPREHLPRIYASADVYVLPSLAEGFPLTALEAMACGLPVIVSENTFAHDVLTDGQDGFIVPIRDSASIAERLVALSIDPELRARLGRNARETAENYSWQRYGSTVVGHVRKALTRDQATVATA